MDAVMENVKVDFEEMGIEEAILNELQRSWESKVVATKVADFSTDDRLKQYVDNVPGPGVKREEVEREQRDEKPVAKQENGYKPRKHSRVKERAPDDDEIGSDLDDPEEDEDVDEEGEGEAGGDLVIALYDKVQRVKNKWKVTLKDGIASVNGKDYLFTKCQGEFEW